MIPPRQLHTRSHAPAEPLGDHGLIAPESERLVGTAISVTDYAGALDWIEASVRSDARAYVCVTNVHSVMAASEDPALHAALRGSAVNVPDGMPLVWALRLLGHRLPDRVYGPELMVRACERAARDGSRFYLYGGRNPGALVQLTLNLRILFPGLQIVGGYSPPHRALTPEEEASVIREINASRADVVWVGIGVPKQEKWMAAMRSRLNAPVLIGVGAAFDFHAGLVPQAPRLLQDAGLEWAYRLLQEPRRLWRRYLRYNPRFVLAIAGQVYRHRRAQRLADSPR